VNRERLLEVLPRFRGKKILVVGDLFLDEYLVGRPTRISREAPVLVLEYERRFCLPGGGTNPARNLQALGIDALMAGVVGADTEGVELKSLLGSSGILTEGVVADPSRPTITKTRILAQDGSIVRQQVVRVDRLSREPLPADVTSRLVAYIERVVPAIDAIIISDYKSGVVSDDVIQACHDLTHRHQKLLTVDSQGDLYRFLDFGLVKCNQAEAEATLGYPLDSEESFRQACEKLLEDLRACVVVVTRGGDGLSIMEAGGPHIHLPVANRSEVFDVTGAGDTAIAVLTAAMAVGARAAVAAQLANYAAGLVVRKIGNATTTVDELADAVATSHFPRVDPDQDPFR
jgi:rfaE bifunctional protein kinase chain/domain